MVIGTDAFRVLEGYRYDVDAMNISRILAVEHVELESPFGLESDVRWFYGELAALDEVAAAPESASSAIAFRSARIELRIRFLETPQIDEVKLRTTILVPSLRDVIHECRARRIDFTPISGVVWTDRRIQLLDPAGNRVELKQSWPYGPI